MRNPLLMAIGVFSVISFVTSTAYAKKTKVEKVFVQIAKKKEISNEFAYPAQVNSKVEALLLSESQGVVTKLFFNLGDQVKKHQIMAKVAHTDPVYHYKPVALRAPVDGVVSKVFITLGGHIAKGEKVLLLTDPKKSKIIIEVTSRDVEYFHKEAKGVFHSDNREEKLNVSLEGISPFIDPATGTATAEFSFDDPEKSSFIRPGIMGRIEFKTNIRQGFLFPQNVISYKGTDPQVKIVSKDNTVKKIIVKIGKKRKGKIEILSGIKEGDYLIERASGFIKKGATVAIQNLPKKASSETKKNDQKK